MSNVLSQDWLSTLPRHTHQASLEDTVALATTAGRRVGCWSGLAGHRNSPAGSRGCGHSGLDGWLGKLFGWGDFLNGLVSWSGCPRSLRENMGVLAVPNFEDGDACVMKLLRRNVEENGGA